MQEVAECTLINLVIDILIILSHHALTLIWRWMKLILREGFTFNKISIVLLVSSSWFCFPCFSTFSIFHLFKWDKKKSSKDKRTTAIRFIKWVNIRTDKRELVDSTQTTTISQVGVGGGEERVEVSVSTVKVFFPYY